MKHLIIVIILMFFLVIPLFGQAWIEVVSPNGGEVWEISSNPAVIWEHSDNFTVFHIQLSRNNGGTWEYLEDGLPGSAHEWVWESGVTGPVSEQCRIKVAGISEGNDYHDISNDNFTITGGEHWIEVAYPNGGEIWEIGCTPTITWEHSEGFESFDVQLSRNNGEDWETLDEGLCGFAIDWTWNAGVTAPPSDDCLVRIVGHTGTGEINDDSNDNFAIIEGGGHWIEVTYPNGGEIWEIGCTPTITWERSDGFEVFHILLSRNNGVTWEYLVNGLPGTTQEWVWETGVTAPASEGCLIKICGFYEIYEISDISNENFTIAGGEHWIEVAYPNGGENWEIGATPTITWDHSDGFETFDVQLSRNNGEDWETLDEGLLSFAIDWTWNDGVTPPPSDDCQVRIVGHTGTGEIFDVSNENFTIVCGGGGGQFEPDEFTQGLWHFNEPSCTYIAHDVSGNEYHLNLEDGAEFTPEGLFAGGIDLLDEDAKINSDCLIGNGWDAITIDAHIYAASIPSYNDEHPIVYRYDWYQGDPSYALTLLDNGVLAVTVYTTTEHTSLYSVAGTIQTNSWYHVAVTWSSGQPLRIFVDDMATPVAEHTSTIVGTIRAGNDPLTVGWFHDTGYGDFFFDGIIDEVRISDIDRYLVQGGNLFEPDEYTEALWHFNEATGTYTAYDATGNGYDMALEDGAEFTAAGLYGGCADITDPDAKINSNYLIGNGWDTLTIDAFIFPTEITGPEHPIVERYRWHNVADPSYYLTISQDESLVGGVYLNDPGSVYSSATTPPGTIETDQWYHVAMTWSSGEPTRIFLNGEMIAESQQVHEGTVRAGDDPLTIGWFHDEGYGDFFFQGTIDEVRISDIDRYAQPPPPPPPPIWGDDFEDGNYTSNPAWNYISGEVQVVMFEGDFALEVYETPNIAAGAIEVPIPPVQEFEVEFDLYRRQNCSTNNLVQVGFNENGWSPGNGFTLQESNSNSIMTAWNGVTLNSEPIASFDHRWQHVRMIRDPSGFWNIIWDEGGPNETLITGQDEFGSLIDPYLWVQCNGFYNEGGAYFDDFTMFSGSPPPPPEVDVTMTPYNPPIVIPPGGDAFAYNISGANNSGTPAIIDVWVNIMVPGGSQFTILGPVNLTLAGGAFIERDRTVFVPGSAPPGEYQCSAYLGNYPWNVIDSDAFPFFKEGGGGGDWIDASGWYCEGERFPGEDVIAEMPLPEKFALHGACPNPFNAKTVISYEIRDAGFVELKVFDITGREVASLVNGHLSLGYHEVVWDAEGMASGVYFVRLELQSAGTAQHAVRKVLLVK